VSISCSYREVPVLALGANVLSPVATTANIRVFVLAVVTLTVGLSPVVSVMPVSSRAQVFPAAALPLAMYTHISTALSFLTLTL